MKPRRSVALRQRLRLARRRAHESLIEDTGLTSDAYRVALRNAFAQWESRMPWKLLPGWLRGALYDRIGTRYAARFVAQKVVDRDQ